MNVEFDGLQFVAAGLFVKKSKPYLWKFSPTAHDLPVAMLQDGKHNLRVAFTGQKSSDSLMVYFHTQPPVLNGQIVQSNKNPYYRTVSGKVLNKLQSQSDTVAVELIFHDEGYLQKMNLPVTKKTDGRSRTYFEFESKITGLPFIAPSDARYAEDFFALKVTDQAGNHYHQTYSYAAFVAPGAKKFGVNIADIIVSQLPKDLSDVNKLSIRVTPKSQPKQQLANGQRAIILKATIVARNIKQLKWVSNIPIENRAGKPGTIVLRDEAPLGISYQNQYLDEQAPTSHEPVYRVEQTGKDGVTYTSNSVKATPPDTSSKPTTSEEEKTQYLTGENVKTMLIRSGYFDKYLNSQGKGILNDLESQTKSGVILIRDKTTGLTWQQSGSEKTMNYDDAQYHINKLNQDKYGGFTDWRLPTLEEAMSLMEPQKRKLYIDLIFDEQQEWIWTADKDSPSVAWVAYFHVGHCYGHHIANNNVYVRAVR